MLNLIKHIERSQPVDCSKVKQSFPNLMERYSTRLLFTGGAVATLVIIAALFTILAMLITDFFNAQLNIFETQHERVKANVDRTQARVKQAVESYELLSNMRKSNSGPIRNVHKGVAHEFSIGITGPETTVIPAMLFSRIEYDTNRGKIKDFLHLIQEFSPISLMRFRDVGYSLGGFAYSADHQLLAIGPPLTSPELQKAHDYGVDNYVRHTIDAVEKQIINIAPEVILKERIVWIPIALSPITNEMTGYYAAPVYRSSERIAVVVASVPLKKFPILFQDSTHQPNFFVLSQNLDHVMGGGEEYSVERRLADLAIEFKADFDKTGDRPLLIYRNGIFIYSQLITGPNWTAVFVFDWNAIISSLKKPLIICVALFCVIISLLWGFAIYFNRSVLGPLGSSSRIIYDSDIFNRAVLNIAPVALTIYEPLSKTIVLQNNEAMKLLETSCDIDGFYRQLLEHTNTFGRHADELEPHAGMTASNNFETRIYDDKGCFREVSVNYSMARYKQTDVLLFGMIDISDQKSTVRYLEEAKQAADKANKAKSVFLATISHEIRTPMHGALGNLELLTLEQFTANQKERLSIIRHSFDALLTLVNDVLDLSKIEAQEFRLNIELFNFVELVERCAQTFAPVISDKGLRFLCLIDPDMEGIWRGDAQRISQVLMNLLSNAVKFTVCGSITLKIAPGRMEGNKQWVHLSLGDTGIGICSDNLDAVFEPFVQADPRIGKRFGGTGLGLALCREITSLMGGFISVDSEPNVGSIFQVNWPLMRENENSASAHSQKKHIFDTVVVCCDAPLWELHLGAQVRAWFPGVTVVCSNGHDEKHHNNAKAILLIALTNEPLFGWWSEPSNYYEDTILVSPHGPLYPERQGANVHVTSFSASMLRLALSTSNKSGQIIESYDSRIETYHQANSSRFLVVEDDPVNRELLRCQLAALGYSNVDCVSNGSEALEKIVITSYELIISDLNMAVMNGLDLIARIRALKIFTPVIISTADLVSRFDLASDIELMYKPISLKQLKLFINKVLNDEVSALTCKDNDALPLDAVSEMRRLLLAEWVADEQTLRHALDTNDSDKIVRLAHRLKGAFLAIGENTGARECDHLCALVKSKNIIFVRSRVEAHINYIKNSFIN
ncbi:ATP-binding protein [Pseudomonas sp. Irchel s3h9]|uniref:ATP-binding protein n=1 Tax=Pseudomonas sp. Irchel s3h9 TaxID=2009192 RepID=UPI0011407018|nr:ATP-binding protein [Pseudomonas sp. Irchel s3h9]